MKATDTPTQVSHTQAPESERPAPLCAVCGVPQTLHAVQKFPWLGFEVDLYHCLEANCPEFYMTRSFYKRPIEGRG